MESPPPTDEDERLDALHRTGLLDRPPRPDLEAITRLATYVTGAQAGAIHLIDRARLWPAAATGMDPVPVPRGESLCDHVVATGTAVHLPDASADPRFAHHPLVDGRRGRIRTYAAVPIRTPAGHVLGTLCVLDPLPGELDRHQLAALDDLGHQVERLIELQLQRHEVHGLQAQLEHQAGHDPLTGLANRRRFTDVVGELLADHASATLVVFGDLDGFRAINDEYGHAAGDRVLLVVADRLRAATRPDDLVARLGGDEFAVLCPGLGPTDAPQVAERLRAAVAEPIALEDDLVRVGLSLGTATSLEQLDVDELLRVADRRMSAEQAAHR